MKASTSSSFIACTKPQLPSPQVLPSAEWILSCLPQKWSVCTWHKGDANLWKFLPNTSVLALWRKSPVTENMANNSSWQGPGRQALTPFQGYHVRETSGLAAGQFRGPRPHGQWQPWGEGRVQGQQPSFLPRNPLRYAAILCQDPCRPPSPPSKHTALRSNETLGR